MLRIILPYVLSHWWHCWHSTGSRDYETVGRPSVRLSCLSVRLIIRPPRDAAASLLLWVQRPGDRDVDRLLHGRRSPAYASEQCHVVSWRRRLNVVDIVQNSVRIDHQLSANSHYRKQCHSTASKDKPRKRLTTVFNVSVYQLLVSKNFGVVDVPLFTLLVNQNVTHTSVLGLHSAHRFSYGLMGTIK